MKKFFATDVKSESDYLSKVRNIEIMKGINPKPTINYRVDGKNIVQFVNYEMFLDMVKGYTDMKKPCPCKKPPSSIVNGVSSYECDPCKNSCKFCEDPVLYPRGKYDSHCDECFYFPRKITTDPCKPCPPPCPPCPPKPCEPCKTNCRPNLNGNMRPCCFKQTHPCSKPDCDSDSDCESGCDIPVTICTNPLLKCYDPCNPCKTYCKKCKCDKKCNKKCNKKCDKKCDKCNKCY